MRDEAFAPKAFRYLPVSVVRAMTETGIAPEGRVDSLMYHSLTVLVAACPGMPVVFQFSLSVAVNNFEKNIEQKAAENWKKHAAILRGSDAKEALKPVSYPASCGQDKLLSTARTSRTGSSCWPRTVCRGRRPCRCGGLLPSSARIVLHLTLPAPRFMPAPGPAVGPGPEGDVRPRAFCGGGSLSYWPVSSRLQQRGSKSC